MSYSPPSTKGQASSPPDAGTPQTVYSPEFSRSNGQGQLSAVAAGKRPVRDLTIDTIQAPQRTQAKFINEYESEHPDFISRHLSIVRFPDGTVAGSDGEVELPIVQARMKEVSSSLSSSSLVFISLLASLTTCQYLAFMQSVPLYSRGVHIRFDSLRDACEAKYLLECLGFTAEYITGYDFAIAKSQDTAAVNDYEGQVDFSLTVSPIVNMTRKGLKELVGYVQQIAEFYGDVRELEHIHTNVTLGIVRYRIEFQSIDAANRMIASVQDFPLYGDSDDQVSSLA